MIHLQITVRGLPFYAATHHDIERLHGPLADLLEACGAAGAACLILARYGNVTRIVGRA